MINQRFKYTDNKIFIINLLNINAIELHKYRIIYPYTVLFYKSLRFYYY